MHSGINTKEAVKISCVYLKYYLVYQNGSLRVEVLGKTTYCTRVIKPPQGVWFYLGIVWNKVGTLGVYYDSWFGHSVHSRCGSNFKELVKKDAYHLGRYTYPTAYYDNLEIWYSAQSRSVFDARWKEAFGKFAIVRQLIIHINVIPFILFNLTF